MRVDFQNTVTYFTSYVSYDTGFVKIYQTPLDKSIFPPDFLNLNNIDFNNSILVHV